jgi:hypothetical protein
MSYMLIDSIGDFRRAVRMGTYADGGYPLCFLMHDSASICPACAKKERREMLEAIRDHQTRQCYHFGWLPRAIEVNWEDGDLWCDHCHERIPSAYAEPEESHASQ